MFIKKKFICFANFVVYKVKKSKKQTIQNSKIDRKDLKMFIWFRCRNVKRGLKKGGEQKQT